MLLVSSLAVVLVAFPANTNAQPVISVHGSGTTNPSKCYWHIMDQLEEQSKNPIRLTYRAVGSSTGQFEVLGKDELNGIPVNHFGSGDIPVSTADYDTYVVGKGPNGSPSLVHLPIMLGAISFFHSLPLSPETGDATQKLHLDACTLAKIMKREITDWNDAEIRNQNPGLPLFAAPFPIRVAHRVLGSSSTASITQYLHQACPTVWPINMVDKEIAWPAGTVGCQGSGGMTRCIREQAGTIGYIDAGHGHAEGLLEIELRNADGNYLSSKEAGENGGILAAFADNQDLPTELDGNFGNVNLLNAPGQYTWPIVAMTYVYVQKDLSALFPGNPQAQGLLRALLQALYDENYIDACQDWFGFVKVTGPLRTKALDAIQSMLVVDAETPTWLFEEFDDTVKGGGQADYVLSGKRDAFSNLQQQGLVDDVASLERQISLLETANAALNTQLTVLQGQMTALSDAQANLGHSHTDDSEEEGATTNNLRNSNTNNDNNNFGDTEETQLMASLVLGSMAFCFWIIAFLVLVAKFGCSCF